MLNFLIRKIKEREFPKNFCRSISTRAVTIFSSELLDPKKLGSTIRSRSLLNSRIYDPISIPHSIPCPISISAKKWDLRSDLDLFVKKFWSIFLKIFLGYPQQGRNCRKSAIYCEENLKENYKYNYLF